MMILFVTEIASDCSSVTALSIRSKFMKFSTICIEFSYISLLDNMFNVL